MYISGINYESVNDGEGVRTVIFISGCKHNCKGCHNKETHSFSYGKKLTDSLIEKISFEIQKRPFLSGITLSGGDPLYQNTNDLIKLIKDLHLESTQNVWLYTGFSWEEIISSKDKKRILPYISYIVDGEYVENLRDVTLKFRGSSNQRIIDVKKMNY